MVVDCRNAYKHVLAVETVTVFLVILLSVFLVGRSMIVMVDK